MIHENTVILQKCLIGSLVANQRNPMTEIPQTKRQKHRVFELSLIMTEILVSAQETCPNEAIEAISRKFMHRRQNYAHGECEG